MLTVALELDYSMTRKNGKQRNSSPKTKKGITTKTSLYGAPANSSKPKALIIAIPGSTMPIMDNNGLLRTQSMTYPLFTRFLCKTKLQINEKINTNMMVTLISGAKRTLLKLKDVMDKQSSPSHFVVQKRIDNAHLRSTEIDRKMLLKRCILVLPSTVCWSEHVFGIVFVLLVQKIKSAAQQTGQT
uniref:Uncharacterized protein n=1 Tax=Romanomermis culicivorax TaxID=13658 RepID=A0A915KB09_ROMCU